MDKRYKPCIFCKNLVLSDRQIKVCDDCLKKAGAEEEVIKEIQAAEEINFVIEDHIEKAEEEIIRRSI